MNIFFNTASWFRNVYLNIKNKLVWHNEWSWKEMFSYENNRFIQRLKGDKSRIEDMD